MDFYITETSTTNVIFILPKEDKISLKGTLFEILPESLKSVEYIYFVSLIQTGNISSN